MHGQRIIKIHHSVMHPSSNTSHRHIWLNEQPCTLYVKFPSLSLKNGGPYKLLQFGMQFSTLKLTIIVFFPPGPKKKKKSV